MLEDKDREQTEIVPKYRHVTAACQLTIYNHRVRFTANPASGAYEVVLPPVAEAAGMRYFLVARLADVVNAVTITHDDDSECWEGDITLDGACDRVILESDGMCWFQCCETLTFSSSASASPSCSPSGTPSTSPSGSPSSSPSSSSSNSPSSSPSNSPSGTPSTSPSESPSTSPSTSPSGTPSTSPSSSPSGTSSTSPSESPSSSPSASE